MKKSTNKNKLTLNKIQVTKLTNLYSIKGGDDAQDNKTKCMFPENGSKPKDPIIIKV